MWTASGVKRSPSIVRHCVIKRGKPYDAVVRLLEPPQVLARMQDNRSLQRQERHMVFIPAQGVQGQPGLQSEFQDSQGYTEPCLEKPNKIEQTDKKIITLSRNNENVKMVHLGMVWQLF